MRNEAKDRKRLQDAIAKAGAGAKKKVMVPWQPTGHNPEPPLSAHKQAPHKRDHQGRFIAE